jgi:hypothetical protein
LASRTGPGRPGRVQQRTGQPHAAARARRIRQRTGVQQRADPGNATPSPGNTGSSGPVLAPAGRTCRNTRRQFTTGFGAVQPRRYSGHARTQRWPGTGGDVLGGVASADGAEAASRSGHAGVLVPGPSSTDR